MKKNITPTAVTISILQTCFVKTRQLDQLKELWQKQRDLQVPFSLHNVVCFLHGITQSNDFSSCTTLFEAITSKTDPMFNEVKEEANGDK